MKTLSFLLVLSLTVMSLAAADGEWLTDLPKAQTKARAENKMVLLDFTGSDWCPPCKSLHNTVLTSAEFTAFAKGSLVLVEVDFPRAKKQTPELKAANAKLQEQYKIEGYPTVIVLDANGKEIFREVGFGGTPAKDYVAKLAKLKK
jgi:protein disulfide-isomerase